MQKQIVLTIFMVGLSCANLCRSAALEEGKGQLYRSLNILDKKGLGGMGGTAFIPSVDRSYLIEGAPAEKEYIEKLRDLTRRASTAEELNLVQNKLSYIKTVYREPNTSKGEVRLGYVIERVIPAIINSEELLSTPEEYLIQYGNPMTQKELLEESRES